LLLGKIAVADGGRDDVITCNGLVGFALLLMAKFIDPCQPRQTNYVLLREFKKQIAIAEDYRN